MDLAQQHPSEAGPHKEADTFVPQISPISRCRLQASSNVQMNLEPHETACATTSDTPAEPSRAAVSNEPPLPKQPANPVEPPTQEAPVDPIHVNSDQYI